MHHHQTNARSVYPPFVALCHMLVPLKSKIRVIHENMGEAKSKETYCELVEKILLQAQKGYPDVSRLKALTRKIKIDFDRCRTRETAKKIVVWHLRQLEKEGKNLKLVRHLRRRMQM